MKPTDIALLQSVTHPTVSPDGERIVFAVTHPDLGADTYVGQLWQVDLSGETPVRRLTRGFRDVAPTFSPDGSLLAFLRATPKGAPQLHVVAATGGEPVAVTDQKLGVSEFSWSPDSRRLVFVSRVPEQGRYGTIESISPSAEPAREITTTRYLANGLGYVTDKRAQIFVTDVPDVEGEPFVAPVASVADPKNEAGEGASAIAAPVQVTSDEADHAHPRFTPDNRAVTFVAALHDGSEFDLRSSAWAIGISADGAFTTTSEIVGGDLGVDDVIATPLGVVFFLAQDLGPDGIDFVGSNTALYVLDAPAGTEGETAGARRLTDPETLDLGASSLVVAGDDSVLVVDTTRGTVQLLRVDATGTVTRLTDGPVEVGGYAAAGGTVAVTVAGETSSGDVAVVREGGLETLTDFSAAVRLTGTRPAVETTVVSRDGTPVHGWVLTPEGDGPHPTLLVIHGGPYSQFTGSLFDEAQVYVAAGYGVVMCNPRGAAGYGQAFGRAIKGAMGTVDLTDVLDFLDGALAQNPTLDPERTGVMGGSYGGYLTAWTIAHDHRFAGAIVERGFLDPEFFVGVSDIGTFFAEQYTGASADDMTRQSPQAVVSQVTTPTFVIHSEDDLRCPLPQAQRYHLGLVRAGVETKMLIFPGENHELSRSGRPRHRVQRFEAILDWWQQYLPVKEA